MSGSGPVFVLGMHRSGTSAVAGVLARIGYSLGSDFIPPVAGVNDLGFFEDRDALALNAAILAALDRQWDHPLALPPDWTRDPRIDVSTARLRALVDRYRATGNWAVKDPRLSLLFPLWRDVVAAHGDQPRVLLCVRDPAEVAASLWVRDHMPSGLAFNLWCYYTLAAEHASRGIERQVVHYADLVSRPARTVRAIIEWLGIDVSPGAERAAVESVVVEQWHQRATAESPVVPPIARRIQGALSGGLDEVEMDSVHAEFAAAGAIFEATLKDQHDLVRAREQALEEAIRQLAKRDEAVQSYAKAIAEQKSGFVEAMRQLQVHRVASESHAALLERVREQIAATESSVRTLARELGEKDQHDLDRTRERAFEEAVRQLAKRDEAVQSYAKAIAQQESGFAEAMRQLEAHRLASELQAEVLDHARAQVAANELSVKTVTRDLQVALTALAANDEAVRGLAATIAAQGAELRRTVDTVCERDTQVASLRDRIDRLEPHARLLEPAEFGNEADLEAAKYQGRIDFAVENNSHTRAARYMREVAPAGGRVLEVGCAGGYFGRAVKELGFEVWGVEADPKVAKIAARHLDRVYEGTIEALLNDLDPAFSGFTFIVFGDVLEHLVDPVEVLRACRRHLRPGGHIIASVPNVAHASVRLMLLEGRWEYADVGILDSTHLHFYTRDGFVDLFSRAGYAVEWLSAITLDRDQAGITVDPRLGDAFAQFVTDKECDAFQFVAMVAAGVQHSVERSNREFLLQAGHRILCLPPAPGTSLFNIRLGDPLARVVERYGGEVRIGNLAGPDPEDVAWCNTVILQREAAPFILELVEKLRAAGKRVIFDIDDYLLDVPEYLSVHQHCRAMRPLLEKLLVAADAVSVSTAPLREALLPFNQNTFISPNYAWTSHAPIAHDESARSTGGVVRILVASSDSVRVDFLVDVLKALVSDHEHPVEIVALGPPGQYLRDAGVPVAALPNVPHAQFKAFVASRANTIALIPLDDNAFNRCKSAVKYFDYALAGVPTICSAITPYANVVTDGVDGLLCPDIGQAWIDAAAMLIGNATLRRRIANEARRHCLAQHTLNKNAAAWQELLRETAFPTAVVVEQHSNAIQRTKAQLLRGTIRHLMKAESYRSVWRLYRSGGIKGVVKQWKLVF